jgi:hypothetical protein
MAHLTPHILSIDVGVKNLAVCLFTPKYPEYDKITNPNAITILYWDIIDLSGEKLECKCSRDNCTTNAKFDKDGILFCLRHAKKEKQWIIPVKETSTTYINKANVKKLIDIAHTYDVFKKNNTDKKRKTEIKQTIIEYFQKNTFKLVKSNSVNASTINLTTVGRNIKRILNEVFETAHITHVAIENQIGPQAIRMKAIQAMLAQYFIMKNDNIHIQTVASSRKLEECKVNKSQYTLRKKIAIEICQEHLKTNKEELWETHFNLHTKKDDLADSLLQGLWVLKHGNIVEVEPF